MAPTAFELNTEATRLLRADRAAEALPLQLQAVKLAANDPSVEDTNYAALLSNLALLYERVGDHTRAESKYRKALDIARRTGFAAGIAQGAQNLAVLLGRQGRYDEALALFEEAIATFRKAGNHLGLASTYANLAVWHVEMSEPDQALQHCRTALNESELSSPADWGQFRDSATPGLSMWQVANVARETGDLALADRALRRALQVTRFTYGQQHPDLVRLLTQLGVIRGEINDADAAIACHRQALEMASVTLGDHHPLTTSTRFALANELLLRLRHAEALDHYLIVETQIRGAPGDNRAPLAGVLGAIAEARSMAGEHAAAEASFRDALALYHETVGVANQGAGTVMHNLGKAVMALGRLDEAENWFRRGLETTRSAVGATHSDVGRTLSSLAILLAERRRDQEALEALLEAAQIRDRMMEAASSIASERQRLRYQWEALRESSMVISLVVQRLSSSPAACRAALDIVLRRKARALDATSVQRAAVLRGRYPQLSAKLRRLDRMRAEHAAATLSSGGATGEVDKAALQKLAADAERLESELSNEIPESHRLRGGEVDSSAVAAALEPDAALLEYAMYTPWSFVPDATAGWAAWRYVGFVLTGSPADGVADVQMFDLGPTAEIDSMVASVVRGLSGRSGRDAVSPQAGGMSGEVDSDVADEVAAAALRVVVLEPLLRHVPLGADLRIAPDGGLSALPFGALTSVDDRYLMEDHCVSYVGVGRDLLRFAQHDRRPAGPSLVVADPDYDLDVDDGNAAGGHSEPGGMPESGSVVELDRAGVEFKPLHGALAEGLAVARLLGVDALVGAAALESRVRAAQSPTVLHLATHGWFLPRSKGENSGGDAASRALGAGIDNPLLRSGLALAGANRGIKRLPLPAEAGDGLLHAADVVGMDLLDTALVVLSACETGLGDVLGGEGVFGLRRVFQEAGASTVVMSLWKLPDGPTNELMQDFYRRVLAGVPCAEALRRAQLHVRSRHPHPANWAAFTCQGYTGPVNVSTR